VPASADEAAVRRAYKRLALQHHPDKAAGGGEARARAERRFKRIADAYSVLSDAARRAEYDREREHARARGGGGGGGGGGAAGRAARAAGRSGGAGFGGGGRGERFHRDEARDPLPRPPPPVLIGHAASLTPY
jgi:molecular chaperone DnaJ